jgi:CBS-domain-containing membrane protein
MVNITKARMQRLMLDADTAEQLMSQGPMSIRQNATLRAAVTLLTDKQVSAAPVIDDAGRPIGVISRTDIIRQVRRSADGDFDENADLPADTTDKTLVRDMMTPAVLSVAPTASVIEVVSMMLGVGQVHQLFVVDDDGILVGVITALDVLRKLRKLDLQPSQHEEMTFSD